MRKAQQEVFRAVSPATIRLSAAVRAVLPIATRKVKMHVRPVNGTCRFCGGNKSPESYRCVDCYRHAMRKQRSAAKARGFRTAGRLSASKSAVLDESFIMGGGDRAEEGGLFVKGAGTRRAPPRQVRYIKTAEGRWVKRGL